MRLKLFLTAFLALAARGILFGQPSQAVTSQPDCVIPFQFTAAAQVAPVNGQGGFNNFNLLTNPGGVSACNVWEVAYASNGFSVISLVLQSAPDNAGVPGSWGTMGGSLVFGVNPNTNTSAASTLLTTGGTAFAPWVRITLASATGSGTVTGSVLGWRQLAAAGSSGAASAVSITSPTGQNPMATSIPVVLPTNQTSGCSIAKVNLAGSGNTQNIAKDERLVKTDHHLKISRIPLVFGIKDIPEPLSFWHAKTFPGNESEYPQGKLKGSFP